MAKQKKLVIIDGKSVFYRGFYAMSNLAAGDGTPTGGVYGFAMMALKVLNEFDPDYVIVAWDKSKTNIRARRKLYKEYKANRKPMPEELREQIPLLRRLLTGFGWPLIELDDYEADDIMATLAVAAREKGLETVLVTSDLDILQAVNSHTKVCALKKGVTQTVMFDRETFTEEYNMTPEQFIDYKALKGDPSDNVPGVTGVGDKTAKDLIKRYESLDGVYEHIDDITGKLRERLLQDKDMAYLSRQLLEIKFDAPAKLDLTAADVNQAKPRQIADIFTELEFNRLKDQLPEQMRVTDEVATTANQTIDFESIDITHIRTQSDLSKVAIGQPERLVLHTLTYESQPGVPAPQAVLVSDRAQRGYILELTNQLTPADIANTLQPLVTDPKIDVVGYNLKNDVKTWLSHGISGMSVGFDVMVAAFLLNPLLRQQSLTDLAQGELGITTHGLAGDELLPLPDWAAQITGVLWQLHDTYSQQLREDDQLLKVAQDMEWPLIPILGAMEHTGIKLDTDYLQTIAQDINQRVDATEKQIFKEAGQEFNINSPQQLQTVLFDKLHLPTTDIKKTKTGYSTAASELDKLRHLHPIIQLLTDYRELTKLKSTYVDALPKLVDKQDRLHTTFNQTVTQTGRLSSDNPNLQNIPIRSELGKQIRRAFTAGHGNTLVSADYSQFELRIAAVLSGDNDMIEAFNSGLDVHTQTAAEVYGVAMEDVTKEQRYSAKTINFGVMYGMSPHGLSVATGMDRAEAKQFINKYFEIREGLLDYLDSLKEKARQDGYVETMFGRKRPMPDIHSSNFMVRAAAERAAINMPIQGTEADLMKMAMIEIDRKLQSIFGAGSQEHGERKKKLTKRHPGSSDPAQDKLREGSDANMLLQIHDSILLECPEDQADEVGALVKDTMEHIYELPVKLDVDVHTGPTWGDLK